MAQSELIESIRAAARPFGLNLIGAVAVDHYDRAVKQVYRVASHAPDARSIVVIGNGGGDFWRAYKAHAQANPGWTSRENPLDDFTMAVMEDAITAAQLRRSGELCAAVYPFLDSVVRLDFMQLGKSAGIAGPSLLGVVINREYGPWIAFRAALLIRTPVDSSESALEFNPCPSCVERSCMPGCPVGAISDEGWNIPACIRHRVEMEADCAPQCHARVECVIGPEHRYPGDEIAYHQERALHAMRDYYLKEIKPTSRAS